MGTLKMLHMKQCKGKNKARHLKNALQYIFNPEKFNERWMGGNAGNSAEEVYSSMMRLKKMLGKESGRQGYHFILTFKPGEVDENLACRITEEFCEAYLKNQYQHTFVLHNDKAHMHTHIIFNSIDMDGNKYHYADGDWTKKIQPLVNGICKKYGLSEINLEKDSGKEIGEENFKSKEGNSRRKGKGEPDSDKKKNRENEVKKSEYNGKEYCQESKKQRSNNYKMKWKQERENLHYQIKEDINSSISEAESMEEFHGIMKEKGYDIHIGQSKEHGEFITFKFKERKGVRSYTLGAGFNVSDIQYQIQNKEKLAFVDLKFRDVRSERYKRIYLHSPENLKRLYLKNTYLIRNWKGERLNMFPQMYKYRKSLEELRQTEEECRYICGMHMESMEQVEAQLHYVDYKIKYLGTLRFGIMDRDGETMDSIEKEEKLIEITKDFKRFMNEKKILERIKTKTGEMEKDEKKIAQQREKTKPQSMEELRA